MLEEFQSFVSALGIDVDNFGAFLGSMIVVSFPLIKIAINIIESFGKYYSIWNSHKKHKGHMFFAIVIYLEFGCVLIGTVLYSIVRQLLIAYKISYCSQGIVLFIAMVFEIIVNIKILLKFVFIRIRLIGNKQGFFILLFLVTISHIYFLMDVCKVHRVWTVCIGVLLLICVEVIGLNIFKGYIEYEYSSVRIFLSNGEMIDCEDISKIKRKFGSLIITGENKQIWIKYEIILKIEYYGDMKISSLE
ncbi:MAG: hypothetical protein HDR00_02580 [Lachnospiraceae bacterium]|nr:hypothetical protein [Lachnospiraceae bacterium]